MKRSNIVFLVLVVLAALYTGVAWFVGKRAQSVVEQTVAQGNARLTQMFGESSSAGLATIADYQRGVFSSQLRYVLDMTDMSLGNTDDAPRTVEFQIHLQHGPFPWDLVRAGELIPHLVYGQIRLLPTAWTQAWFDVAGENTLTAQMRMDFSQDGRVDVAVAPIVVEKGGEALRFSGGALQWTYVNRFADGQGTGAFASLDIVADGDSLRMRDIAVTGRSHQGEDVVQSESHLGVASIEYIPANEPASRFEDVGIDFSSEQVATLMDYSVQYRLGKASLMARDLGAFEAGASATRVDVPALMALMQALERMEGAESGLAPVELNGYLHTLLEAQPTIAIDPLRWITDKGESRAVFTADLHLPEDAEGVSFEDFGLQILRQAHVSVEVSRPMAVHVASLIAGNANPVSQAMFGMMFDQTASQLQGAGLVRIQDEQVSLQASYRGEDESVELNGRRMPLEEFLMLIARVF